MISQDEIAASNRLQQATEDYASLQEMIDRYNKVFETYSRANIDTQWRAASVMRQALDEYNNLKLQQQTNALRIYQAQKDVDYYRQISPVSQVGVPTKYWQVEIAYNNTPAWTVNVQSAYFEPEYPTTAQEIAPSTYQVSNKTEVTTPTGTTKRIVPTSVQNIINSQTPKYSNTTIGPVTTQTPTYNVTGTNYWPGTVATIPSPNVTTTTPWATSTWKRRNPGTRRQFNLNR